MKKILFFLMMLTISIVGFAQSSEKEKAQPMTNTEIVRKCAILDVEGHFYKDVTVTVKSNEPNYIWTVKYKVKVTVTDAFGAKVWDKTFKNACLYVFSNGQIQIGQKHFNQMIIGKISTSGDWVGIVREKEGVY